MGIVSVKAGIVAAGIAGTLTLGAMTMWNGGASLTAAKNLIVQQADSLGIYHTHEGQLLNKISGLKSQIAALSSDDTAQIADLTAQLNKDEADLANAQANGEQLGQRIDDLEAQVQKANADAADLQTTVDGNSTVSQSDDTAVATALGDDNTTPVVTPTPDPTPTPAPSPVIQGTEVDYISATMPVTLTSNQVKLDKDANNNLYLLNVSDYNQQYSLDGTTYNTISSMTDVTTIGTLDSMDGHVLYIKDQNGVVHTFTLMKK